MRLILVLCAAVGVGVAAVEYGDYGAGVEIPHYEYQVMKHELASAASPGPDPPPPPSTRYRSTSVESAALDDYLHLDYEPDQPVVNDKKSFVKKGFWNKKVKRLHSRQNSNTNFRTHFHSRTTNRRYKLKNDELRDELIWRRTKVGPEQRYADVDNDLQDIKDDFTEKIDDFVEFSQVSDTETIKRNQRESDAKKAPDRYYDQVEMDARGRKARREPAGGWRQHAARRTRRKTSTQDVAQYDDVKRLQSHTYAISSVSTKEDVSGQVHQETTENTETTTEEAKTKESTTVAAVARSAEVTFSKDDINSRLAWTQLPLKEEIEWLQGATWSEKEQRKSLQETTGYPYELLDKAKDILKKRVRSQAKDLRPSSPNWDVLVCDFIDVALLKDSSVSLSYCPILVFMSLFLLVIN